MRRVLPAALLAAAMLSSPAWAGWIDPVTVTDVSMTNPIIAYVNPPGLSAYVGPFTLSGRSWDLAWCLDLYHDIYLGPQNPSLIYKVAGFGTTTDPTGPISFLNLDSNTQHRIAGLMQEGDTLLWNHEGGDPSNVGAAIQLAIWSVEYGDVFSYSGASDSVQALMRAYLGESLTSNHGLMLWDGHDQTLGKIPEPMTIAILGVGILGLGLARKRR
jgi:hypothetical protein